MLLLCRLWAHRPEVFATELVGTLLGIGDLAVLMGFLRRVLWSLGTGYCIYSWGFPWWCVSCYQIRSGKSESSELMNDMEILSAR